MAEGQLTVYRSCEPILESKYQKGGDTPSPSVAIINAVAEAAGVDPLELPPLYESIDTDALDNLFGDLNGVNAAEKILSFRLDKWNVFVSGDGRIRVCDATRPTEPVPVF